MNPAEVLLELVDAGVVLWVEGSALRYRAPVGRLDEDLRARSAAARPALIALVCADAVLPSALERWPASAREDFEERAGFLQFEGGLQREEAEREAERLVRLEHARAFVSRHALVVEPPARAVAAGAGGGPYRR